MFNVFTQLNTKYLVDSKLLCILNNFLWIHINDYPWYICFVECDTLNSTYMIFKKISCTEWGLSFLWEGGLSYCIAQVNSLQFFKEGECGKTCIDYRFVYQWKSCKMSLFSILYQDVNGCDWRFRNGKWTNLDEWPSVWRSRDISCELFLYWVRSP